MRAFQNEIATVSRLTQTGNKSAYSEVGDYECYVRQLDAMYAQQIGMSISNSYQITFEGDADVQIADKLSIGLDTYKVQGSRKDKLGGVDVINVFAQRDVV